MASTAPCEFKVSIIHWHAVAAWTWSAGEDDVCGICHMPFDGCPPECKFPGDDSPVVWGACSHAFHLQCIQKWLASTNEQRCPMCRREWEYKSALDEAQGAQGGTPAMGGAGAVMGDDDTGHTDSVATTTPDGLAQQHPGPGDEPPLDMLLGDEQGSDSGVTGSVELMGEEEVSDGGSGGGRALDFDDTASGSGLSDGGDDQHRHSPG